MQTQAQKRFDIDYAILRRLFLKGKSQDKDRIKQWIRLHGEAIAREAEREVKHSVSLAKKLRQQSGYELELMDDLHEEEGYDSKEEEIDE